MQFKKLEVIVVMAVFTTILAFGQSVSTPFSNGAGGSTSYIPASGSGGGGGSGDVTSSGNNTLYGSVNTFSNRVQFLGAVTNSGSFVAVNFLSSIDKKIYFPGTSVVAFDLDSAGAGDASLCWPTGGAAIGIETSTPEKLVRFYNTGGSTMGYIGDSSGLAMQNARPISTASGTISTSTGNLSIGGSSLFSGAVTNLGKFYSTNQFEIYLGSKAVFTATAPFSWSTYYTSGRVMFDAASDFYTDTVGHTVSVRPNSRTLNDDSNAAEVDWSLNGTVALGKNSASHIIANGLLSAEVLNVSGATTNLDNVVIRASLFTGFASTNINRNASGVDVRDIVTVPGGGTYYMTINGTPVYTATATSASFLNTTSDTIALNGTTTIAASKYAQTTLTPATSVAINFATADVFTLSNATNVTFTTSNIAAGGSKSLIILNDSTARTVTWPAGWHAMGSPLPSGLSASKYLVVNIYATSTTDASCLVTTVAEQ